MNSFVTDSIDGYLVELNPYVAGFSEGSETSEWVIECNSSVDEVEPFLPRAIPTGGNGGCFFLVTANCCRLKKEVHLLHSVTAFVDIPILFAVLSLF